MKISSASAVFRHLPKSSVVFAALGCFLATVPLTAHAEREPSVTVQVLDRATQQEVTTVRAGSRVKLVTTVVIPQSLAGGPITVDVVARLKIVGVEVPYKLPKMNLSVPNVNPQDGGTLVQTGKDVRIVRIPPTTPRGSSVTFTAQAAIAGVPLAPVSLGVTVH